MKHRLTPADRKVKRYSQRMSGPRDSKVAVDASRLLPNNSYGVPEFVQRGYYQDEPFKCRDCGKDQVWTAFQQRWWYEVIQANVDTRAVRCRDCRQRERARSTEARRVHLEGMAAKRAES